MALSRGGGGASGKDCFQIFTDLVLGIYRTLLNKFESTKLKRDYWQFYSYVVM